MTPTLTRDAKKPEIVPSGLLLIYVDILAKCQMDCSYKVFLIVNFASHPSIHTPMAANYLLMAALSIFRRLRRQILLRLNITILQSFFAHHPRPFRVSTSQEYMGRTEAVSPESCIVTLLGAAELGLLI